MITEAATPDLTRLDLTPVQARTLRYLQRQIDTTGICPSYDDIAAALGWRSRSSAMRRIEELEARGFVRRIPGRKRAVTIVRRVSDPDACGICPRCGAAMREGMRP